MDTASAAYRLMELTAISGECSPDVLSFLGISKSYGEKLITRLKEEKYLKTHYKDRLRGYRLTCRGKRMLLAENAERFSFYLDGNCETNRPRSDYSRRLRLQQASLTYALLINAGVCFFRDEKPLFFRPHADPILQFRPPVFFHSREIKELGPETVKINNSRLMGILLADRCIYAIFYTGDCLMKWEYRTELKVKALLTYHVSRGLLSPWYHPDTPIKAILIGKDMDTCLKLMTSTGGFQKTYFYLDGSFDYFHYLPASHAGETMLQLLCFSDMSAALRRLMLSDLSPPSSEYRLEHDGMANGLPVMLAFDLDMLRLSRFCTALSLHGLTGNLICFDFQTEVLEKYFGQRASITSIDLQKFERRFLCRKAKAE